LQDDTLVLCNIDLSPILQTHKTSSIIKEKDVLRNG